MEMTMRAWILVATWLLCGALAGGARAAMNWEAGVNYSLIEPPQPTSVPAGKVEVTEVFSYACPACNHFYPIVDRLRDSLPPNAVLDFLPAGFRPDEDWPMFQRAYFAAQVLGIDKRTHDAMFDAVWKSGELGISDPRTNRLKNPMPGIQDAAAWYARVAGIKPEAFLAAANSFGVDTKIRQADQTIRNYRVESTPTIVVAGKYRLDAQSAGGTDQLIELVKYLVAKESPPAAKPAGH
jgi:thiol:disulfide interchange protein DsbA